ncbi:isoprenoid synthase domain-containing protein [Phlebopus sp. FC_14]|nr:isoprenoid synthase domain-containing protein [Phlebopus sp. FC_14]
MTNSVVSPSKADIVLYTRTIILSFLRKCGLPCESSKFDQSFYNDCCGEAIRRGYPMDGKNSVRTFMPGGVAIATTAYAHLHDRETRILIALFTACAIYLDDTASRNIGSVYLFNERFLRGVKHGDKIMDAFAELLLDLASRYHRVAANIMITSTLNGVTALLLEYETQGMAVSSYAYNYPTFCRVMSGASEAYALLAFPADIPMDSYIQALPDLAAFVDNTNDVLSFYKEELDGESVNRISLLAACRTCSKEKILGQIADKAVEAHENILPILEHNARASEAYKHFSRGFVAFHTAFNRYRLDDLDLQQKSVVA